MLVDPGEASDVESGSCSGHGDVGETGFAVIDRAGEGAAGVVLLVAVAGWWEVVGDPHTGPFAAFGFVGGRDGHVRLVFVSELVDGGEDGVRAVLVNEVD